MSWRCWTQTSSRVCLTFESWTKGMFWVMFVRFDYGNSCKTGMLQQLWHSKLAILTLSSLCHFYYNWETDTDRGSDFYYARLITSLLGNTVKKFLPAASRIHHPQSSPHKWYVDVSAESGSLPKNKKKRLLNLLLCPFTKDIDKIQYMYLIINNKATRFSKMCMYWNKISRFSWNTSFLDMRLINICWGSTHGGTETGPMLLEFFE